MTLQTSLQLIGVSKSFDDNHVLKRIDLTVRAGEFISLLGPSGCGKTTTLNIIAGFVESDKGDILIDGEKVNEVPTHKRNLAMVFQNYSLFPHMSVYENVAFGLRRRKIASHEIADRVRECLELVDLEGFQERLPRQLSGGQQQRVGLARALSVRPKILLLDEPLSNLDAKLRKAMQVELRTIQKKISTTTVYVTHDQEEALTLSDRIAVMNRGVIEQIGTPEEIYLFPKTEFVAEFMGVANFFDGVVEDLRQNQVSVDVKGTKIEVANKSFSVKGQKVRLAIRPEQVSLRPLGHSEEPMSTFNGVVVSRVFAGNFIRLGVHLENNIFVLAHLSPDLAKEMNVGIKVEVYVAPNDWLVLSAEKNNR